MNGPRQNFSYVFEVCNNPRGPFNGSVTEGFGECLLGPAPELTWTDDTPSAGKRYARVQLQATGTRGAAAGVSFVVDRELLTVLWAGDQLRIAALPALGLSILHNGLLLAAAGPADVLAQMSLGPDVDVRYPGEHLERRFFQQPGASRYFLGGPAPHGKPFVEIVAAGETRIMWGGQTQMGKYEVLVRDSVRPEMLLLSFERRNIRPETPAHTSAQLLDKDGYQIIE